MSSVPLSMQQLEDIATEVARNLLEQWAIDDRFKEEDMAKAAAQAVDDTIFVINNFMEHFNYHMMNAPQDKKLIQ